MDECDRHDAQGVDRRAVRVPRARRCASRRARSRKPHPTLLLGGTSKVAARRAARFGLPLLPAAHMPELEAYYYEQCAEHGTQGFCMMPRERHRR